MSTSQIRQMRDFLHIFNTISENCFRTCIDTFVDRSLSQEEIACADRCVTKYLRNNHAVMRTYVEVQPKMMEKKMEEINRMMEEAPQKHQPKEVSDQ